MYNILVLMSVYNGELYLSEQINSILSQEDVSIELLIRDDGSVDNSKEIIKDFILKYPNKIELLIGDNVGFAESFSFLLREAFSRKTYDFYAFADQDDVWMPNKLIRAAHQLSLIKEPNKPCAYCSNATLVDKSLNYLKMMHSRIPKITKENALIQNLATGCTMLFNHKAVALYVEYRPIFVKVHDYLLFLICVYLGYVIYDPNSYIKYRQHGNNQIGSLSFLQRMKRRLVKFGNSSGYYLRQSKDFLVSYKSLLDIEDVLRISYLCNYKNNFFNKLSLLFNGKYKYDSLEFNFFMTIKVLLGKL